jgi:RimJ/RimL family protein N-acetyltransferase
VNPFEPVVLAGTHVRLEPLAPDHVPGLVAAAAEDRATFNWTMVPNGETELRTTIERAEQERQAGLRLGFATVHLIDQRIVGSTSFLDPQRWSRPDPNRSFDSIEIGATWLAASAQRTAINTEAKFLMLEHAFGVWNVHRVVFNTDERNERSRAAIARIGATFEGVLRGFRYGIEGTPRNTATFSVTAHEWPDVRARLETRLKRT